MKSGKTDGIFEITKRRFNPPAAIIKLFETVRREIVRGEIGDQRLIRILVSFGVLGSNRFMILSVKGIGGHGIIGL